MLHTLDLGVRGEWQPPFTRNRTWGQWHLQTPDCPVPPTVTPGESARGLSPSVLARIEVSSRLPGRTLASTKPRPHPHLLSSRTGSDLGPPEPKPLRRPRRGGGPSFRTLPQPRPGSTRLFTHPVQGTARDVDGKDTGGWFAETSTAPTVQQKS